MSGVIKRRSPFDYFS